MLSITHAAFKTNLSFEVNGFILLRMITFLLCNMGKYACQVYHIPASSCVHVFMRTNLRKKMCNAQKVMLIFEADIKCADTVGKVVHISTDNNAWHFSSLNSLFLVFLSSTTHCQYSQSTNALHSHYVTVSTLL